MKASCPMQIFKNDCGALIAATVEKALAKFEVGFSFGGLSYIIAAT